MHEGRGESRGRWFRWRLDARAMLTVHAVRQRTVQIIIRAKSIILAFKWVGSEWTEWNESPGWVRVLCKSRHDLVTVMDRWKMDTSLLGTRTAFTILQSHRAESDLRPTSPHRTATCMFLELKRLRIDRRFKLRVQSRLFNGAGPSMFEMFARI